MRPAILQANPQKSFDFLAESGSAFHLFASLGGEHADIAGQRRQIKLLFRFEIEINRTFGDGGFGRYVVH